MIKFLLLFANLQLSTWRGSLFRGWLDFVILLWQWCRNALIFRVRFFFLFACLLGQNLLQLDNVDGLTNLAAGGSLQPVQALVDLRFGSDKMIPLRLQIRVTYHAPLDWAVWCHWLGVWRRLVKLYLYNQSFSVNQPQKGNSPRNGKYGSFSFFCFREYKTRLISGGVSPPHTKQCTKSSRVSFILFLSFWFFYILFSVFLCVSLNLKVRRLDWRCTVSVDR